MLAHLEQHAMRMSCEKRMKVTSDFLLSLSFILSKSDCPMNKMSLKNWGMCFNPKSSVSKTNFDNSQHFIANPHCAQLQNLGKPSQWISEIYPCMFSTDAISFQNPSVRSQCVFIQDRIHWLPLGNSHGPGTSHFSNEKAAHQDKSPVS